MCFRFYSYADNTSFTPSFLNLRRLIDNNFGYFFKKSDARIFALKALCCMAIKD